MKGISGKLILVLLLSAVLVVTVIGAMDYHAGQKITGLRVEKDLAAISNRLSLSLRRPVYEFNRVAARDTILGEFANEGLEAVLVWSNSRTHFIAGLARQVDGSLAESSIIPQGVNLLHQRHYVDIQSPVKTDKTFIVGEIDIVFNREPLEKLMLEELLLRQAKIALTILLLLLVLAEVIRRSLVQPLEHIRQAMLAAEASISAGLVKDDKVSRLLQLPEHINKGAFDELRHMSNIFQKVVKATWLRQGALLESEARYRELVEEAAALVVKMDIDFVCMYANPMAEKIIGIPANEAIGRRVVEFIHPEDRRSTWRILTELTKGHSANVNIENRLVALDGNVTYIDWTISVAYDYSGAPVYFRAIGRDVTIEKIAIRKLKENEEYFRTVIQTSPDTIALIKSVDGTVLDVNDVGLETFGFSREEFNREENPEEKSTLKLDIWEDSTERKKFIHKLQEDGKIDNHEVSFLTRDGKRFTGLMSARAIEHHGDDCHLSFIKDISEIKAAAVALQESESKYRQLSQEFEAVLDGIVDSLVLLSSDLKVIWGNRGASLQFGMNHDELVGKSCHQLWIGAEEGLCDECVSIVFRTGKSSESMRTTTDGRTWGVKGYPVFDNDGQVINVIQIASDLTEKMQLREEASRSAHLAALGSLSAGIAHEINNPTGLMLMALPFVKDSMEDLLPLLDDYIEEHPGLMVAGLPYATFREEILQTIEDMQGGAQRVKQIVEDLKDFAREKSRDEDTEVNLGEVVEKSLRLLHNIVKNSTDNFILEMEENLPTIKGAAQRMEQVLVNLVQNACQALTSREQSVTLSLHADDARSMVVLRVADEGRGIEKELIKKITDPFFTTRREDGGTGLGLSVSTRIIEEHGGTLNISSEPGIGSVFTIELPVTNGARA